MLLAADRGGAGPSLLLLLHGLGATRQVWIPLEEELRGRWSGRWLAPDLPGHGRSGILPDYALGLQAGAIAELLRGEAPFDRLFVVGHSLGAALALTLGSGLFGVRPACVLGLGLKSVWSEADLDGLARRAVAPTKVFPSEREGREAYLRASGLEGLVAPDSAIAAGGVCMFDGGWRLATIPRAYSVGAPPMATLCAAAAAPFSFACGENDPLVQLPQLTAWDPRAVGLTGLGHNAMVEGPTAVWNWIAKAIESDHDPAA